MYPNRPFCLLVPDPQFLSSTAPPAEYENDGLSPDGIDRTICPQGSKTAGLASDYFEICNRRRFTGDANVDFVGVFIDESGSMTRSTVKASLAKFEEDLASFGLAISSLFNGREDWITAFRNLFSAWVCSHCLAATTNGTMIGICDHCSQVCSADATCNEETDCLRDCTGIDTLQNEGAIIAQVKHVDN